MKKVKCGVSLILAALMLLSVFAIAPVSAFAAGGKTVTFVPGEANEASPVWFAWTWTKDSEGDWVTGTKKGENVTFGGILENVVFVRMPAGSTEPDWDTAWNQTEDLTTDGNVFTFTEWKEIKGKSYMAGEWTTEGNTDPTTSSDNKEGTYTATLDTGSYTADGNWFVWTWTNKGDPGHWVEGTKSGKKISFEGLCNRVIFASFEGAEVPDEDWTGRVAQTDTLTLRDGGTFTLDGKTAGVDGLGTKIDVYSGKWSGGVEVAEVVTPSTPAGTKEGSYTASVDMGSASADGAVFAWTWTFGEVNGRWVAGTASGSTVSFKGLNNRIIFATFEGVETGETPDTAWTGKVAQTQDLSLKHGGTYTITGKEKTEKGDYYKGAWSGGVDVPDEPETDPAPTDLGTYKAKLDAGEYAKDGAWWAWTWNDGGAKGHWIQGVEGEDGVIVFDALCDTVIFGAFKGKPVKDWSNRVGKSIQTSVVDTATFTITTTSEGTDEFSGEPLLIYVGEWGEPEETTAEPTETEETTATEETSAEVTTEPTEETTAAPVTEATEATTAAPTTEATEATTTAAPTTEATEPTTTAAPTTEATEPTTTAEPTTEATEATTAEPTTEATEATTAEHVTETTTVEPTTAAPTTEPATTEPPTTQPATEKEKVDISKWDVIGIVNATYNGKAITQKVLVTDNVNVAQYDVSYTDNVNAGTATMIITGKDGYTGTIVKHFKIYKAKQKPTVKAKKKKVKVKALSAKKVLVKKSITVKNGIGAVSYKKVSGSKFLKISKKGVITVKKGTYKKGKTLKIKVKVTVKGNANYASFSKKVTVKIKTK